MKHVRNYEKFRVKKNREDIIKESVLQVNDIYKVKAMIDIPQSIINQYVKKVKDTTGKNLKTFFGDVDIAEEIVKWVTMNFIDVDKIPGGALMGGQTQAQAEPQAQPQAQPEPQAQPQVQPEAQPQVQVQVDGQSEFEEPQAQGQAPEQGEEEEEEELPL